MIANCTPQNIKKEKGAPQDNRIEKDTRSITETKFRLIGPGVPLAMPKLINQSLDFTNTLIFLREN